MNSFAGARDAKEFLVAKIVGEAHLEGISLSEVERKMLYSSETAWAPPGIMEVNDEFDRDYDQEKYERRLHGSSTTHANGLARKTNRS